MSDFRFIEILRNHKDYILLNWYEGLSRNYPDFYNKELVIYEAELYFQFMLDIEIPVEHHKYLAVIPAMCEHFFHKKIPIDHIILSNQLWVDTLLFSVEQHPSIKTVPLALIRTLIQRVYEYERRFISNYYKMTNELLEKQEQTMTELHEERLTTVGKMAASMAHEIRNPLTTIIGFLKFVRQDVSNRSLDKVNSYLDIIEAEFQNIQMQITGFLSFSKKNVSEEPYVVMSLSAIVQSVIGMITPRLIDQNINLQLQIEDDLQLKLQKTTTQQVISNILNNSIDALSEIDQERRLIVRSHEEGDSFIISITNNGPQIPEDVKSSLFQPFVTSKKQGTGLGLSICKQIMTKNSGDVTFDSDLRETSFRIIFHIPSSV